LDETNIEMRDEKRKMLHVKKNRMPFLWQIISGLETEASSWSIELKLTLDELEFNVQNISAEKNEQTKERDTNKMDSLGKIENLPSLPKVEVPTFGGDARDWNLFQELYGEFIHTRESLSTSLKFNYLKSALKGEARKVVAHLLLGSAENYDAAWELLTKQYKNK